MNSLEHLLKALGKIDNTPPEGEQDTAPPDWMMVIVDAVIQLYRERPKHPGTGRPLPPETYSASFAACVASEYHKDQKAPERFLKNWLGVHETNPERLADLVQALLEELRRQWAKPFDDPDLWVFDNERCLAYLRKVVPREATRIRRRREAADEAWGQRRLRDKRLPDQCEFNPEVHENNPHNTPDDDLLEFHHRERENFLLKQVEEVLPERQYQVLALLVQGAGYEEIANRLGISTSAAKSNMSHARKNADLQRIVEQWKG